MIGLPWIRWESRFFPFKGLEEEEQKFHLLSQPNNSQEVGMVN